MQAKSHTNKLTDTAMDLSACELFCSNEKYLLLNVNNSKFISLEDKTYKIIKQLKEGKAPAEVFMEYPEELQKKLNDHVGQLLRDKKLDTGRRDFSREAVDYISKLHLLKSSVAEGMFILCQDCNLACKYCYGGESGSYGGARERMTKEVAIQGLKFMLENKGVFKTQKVSLFGGEPLLNFDVIKEMYSYWQQVKTDYKDHHLDFVITTNCTLMTPEIARYFHENKFVVIVSLDGPEDVNDKYRRTKNNKGTYHKIMEGIKLLQNHHVPFMIRTTLTANTDLKRIKSYFKENKFETVIFNLADEAMIEKEFEYQFDINDYREYLKQEIDGFKDSIRSIKNNDKQSFETKQVSQVFANKNRKSVYWPFMCGAGWSLLAFDAQGRIYLCPRAVGKEQFHVGNVFEGQNKRKLQEIYRRFIENNKDCNTCWAMNKCKGHCMVIKSDSDGNFSPTPGPICDAYKETVIEEAMLSAEIDQLSKDNKEIIDDIITWYDNDRVIERIGDAWGKS
jgi:uncharacterized protein